MKKVYSQEACPERAVASRRGFALIEMVVGVFVLVTVGLAVAGAFVAAIKSVVYTKTVIAATALANEEMETLHNLPYNDLATTDGSVDLPNPVVTVLPDNKEVIREGIKFNVYTVIKYYNDPFDDITGQNPPDLAPYDYKKVSISVGLIGKPALTTLATNIGAKAAETTTDTGVLKICVITAPFPYSNPGSQPVPGALVTISKNGFTSRSASTEVDTGCVEFYKLPPDTHNHYHVTVTLAGFSEDWTYSGPANQNPHADKADPDISVQQVTSRTLTIDLLSSMAIQFRDASGNPIPNVAFTLTGAKLVNKSPNTPKYPATTFTADADGKVTIPNLEFDDYSITNISGSNRLIALSPTPINLDDPDYPIQLFAGVNPLSVIATLSTSATDPTITSITPTSDQVGQTATIQVSGSNFQSGLVAKLYRIPDGGGPRVDITGTTTFVSTDEINTIMNLAGAAVGKWNLEIVNPDTKKVVLFNGFEVTN